MSGGSGGGYYDSKRYGSRTYDSRSSRPYDRRNEEDSYSSRRRYHEDSDRRYENSSSSRKDRRDEHHRDKYYEARPNDKYEQRGSSRRNRSRSPTLQSDPSPDYLGPVGSLFERERHLQNWDVAPPGFERIRADIAKSTGLFPPPGNITKMANYVPPTLDPARAALLATLSTEGGSVAGPLHSRQHHHKEGLTDNRNARRVKVSAFGGCGVEDIREYFNGFVKSSKPNYDPTAAVESVASVHLGVDNLYALVEFYSLEDTQLVLSSGGHALNGFTLKVEKPLEATDAMLNWDLDQGSVEQLVLYNLPKELTEAHVKQLLTPFGQLVSFVFLKDRRTGTSLGTVVFEMDEPVIHDLVLQGLNNQKLGKFELKVRKVADCKSERALWSVLSAFDLVPVTASCTASNILQLFNLLPIDAPMAKYTEVEGDLSDYIQSMEVEIKRIEVPTPSVDVEEVRPGVGKVFVEFGSASDCAKVLRAIAGKQYEGRTVFASFYPPERFYDNDF